MLSGGLSRGATWQIKPHFLSPEFFLIHNERNILLLYSHEMRTAFQHAVKDPSRACQAKGEEYGGIGNQRRPLGLQPPQVEGQSSSLPTTVIRAQHHEALCHPAVQPGLGSISTSGLHFLCISKWTG